MGPTPRTSGSKRERGAEDRQAGVPVPEEFELPLASITRIIKAKLPDGINVNKDTRVALGKACSIFILYLSTIASDISKENKRQTVYAQDVLDALSELEFDEIVPSLEVCLAAFREEHKARSIEAQAKKAARAMAGSSGAAAAAAVADEVEETAAATEADEAETAAAPADEEAGTDGE